jgi:aminoglycoside phosphotransferase (APT) family kinase protein
MTTRETLLARYAAGSGRDVADVRFFVALSYWRLACILEGVLSRHLSGARGDGDADLDTFRRRVEDCAQLAEETASTL